MTEHISDLKKEIAYLQERLNTANREKANLLMAVSLINQISQISRTTDIVDSILQILVSAIGGSNISIYYEVDGRWRYIDVLGEKKWFDTIENNLVNDAISRRTFCKAEESAESTLTIAGFPKTYETWVYPLSVHEHCYGAICLQGMAIEHAHYRENIDPFIKYSSLLLYHEITNVKKLQSAYNDVHRAQESLKASLEFNQAIINTSPVGLLVFKESGPCVMTNPAAAQIAGASQKELLQLNYKEMQSYQRSGILADIQRVLATGEVCQRIIRTVNTFGKDVWFEGYITSFGSTGIKHVLFYFQDIWDKKVLEEKLLKQHAEFQAIFDSITDAIVFVDIDRRILRVNPAFEHMLGYRLEEVKGETTQLIYADPETYPRFGKERSIQQSPAAQPVREVRYRRKDGTVFPSETIGGPVTAPDGNILGYIGVIRDITARKEMEREKEELQKQWQQSQKLEALGTLAGGIAHDFNNILGVIIGYTEMLYEDSQAESKNSDDLEQVLHASLRAKDLVQQILAFSRQSQAERVQLNIKPLIKETLKMLRASIPATIQIQENLTDDRCCVEADATQIHQIIMNLCTNAFHSMEESGGTLSVKLETKDNIDPAIAQPKDNYAPQGYIHIAISDTGSGIPPEIIEKIFDPFFTTKEKGKGTGIGLSTAYGIIKEHKGHISVDSNPDRGSTFHVFLPSSEKALVPATSEAQSTTEGREHILFVDDEELLARMSKTMLQRLGYQVTVRHRSFEALELFQNQPDQFDVVITDQAMPGMSGLDLAKRLLQIRPDIPIILCTGYSTLVNEEIARNIGIKEFALKPITKATIGRLLRKVLGDDQQ